MTRDVQDVSAVLEHRARQLARPIEADAPVRDGADAASSLLVVRIGDERVGIALDHVVEVHRTARLTPIPGAVAPVVGVIAWRGRVLTVLDIAQRRQGAIVLGESTRILVMGHRRATFGIVADEVEDVRDVHAHQIEPVDDLAAERRDVVRGVTTDALVVVDAAALVARFATSN